MSTDDWNCSQKRGHDSVSPEKGSNFMVGSLIVGAMGVWEGSVVAARRIVYIQAASVELNLRVAL